MIDRKERIEHVIIGVIAQAFADAGTHRFSGTDGYAAVLCERAGGVRGEGLKVSAATKTDLLLGAFEPADLYPLGDLYASQVAELTTEEPPVSSSQDAALQRLFDERLGWDQATAHLTPEARALLKERLATARFRRTRVGLVPKLGARTLGIDLFA